MKLKHKLTALVLGVLLAAFFASVLYSAASFRRYSLSILADSEKEKLDVTAHVFSQVGTREDFEQMGEIARDAYLKYQFQRCYQYGYALLKNNVCIENLTDYDIISPAALTGDYMVQKLHLTQTGIPGGQNVQLLLLKYPLEYPEGYEVLSVKDITSAWRMSERQILFMAAVFVAGTVLLAALFVFILRHMLKGLDDLRTAAAAISGGALGRQVPVRSNDEIGQGGRAFNQMSSQIEEQVENLQLLLGALAHEMKTPVTSIIGYADSLLHVRLSEKQKAIALQNILDSGKRMETMSAKLLMLIGMYENDALEKRPVLLSSLFQQVQDGTGVLLNKKNIRLSVSCPSDLSVTGDAGLLLSLIMNLIGNSLKASQPGDTIWLSARENVITVRDQGCGIPEKDLPFVTNPFYMADKSRSRGEGGSGLGLALAERIANHHNAVLSIASREGQGTTVAITFPLEAVIHSSAPPGSDPEHF